MIPVMDWLWEGMIVASGDNNVRPYSHDTLTCTVLAINHLNEISHTGYHMYNLESSIMPYTTSEPRDGRACPRDNVGQSGLTSLA
jgi:hypothetical protein